MNDMWGQKSSTRADSLKEYNTAQELYERRRRMPMEVSDNMARSVSEQRRAVLEKQVQSGYFREKGSMPDFVTGKWDMNTGNFIPTGLDSSNNQPDFSQQTQAGFVSGKGFTKSANFGGGGAMHSSPGSTNTAIGNSWRGSNDSVRQVPEVYSPLWLNSNLNLPRDRATINSWSRSFFALNPIVQNAISLHSTYPISRLNIKSKNRRVENFFADMIEEIDLMNICVQIAQEYWTLGEAFVYAELDQSKGKWKRLLIQNPDYITVKRSAMAGDPIMSLRPDENLIKIVNSNDAASIHQRKQLGPEIVEYIKRGKNIPLNNFNVSHLARKISPYEVRGTGLIVSSFRQLMLFDKLRECYSDDTEFLTPQGWKTIDDVMEVTQSPDVNPNYVNGIQLNSAGNVDGVYKLKDDVEVLTFNPGNDRFEVQKPEELHMSWYEGEMVHFHGDKVDCLVSPNHKMWTKKKGADWDKVKASDMLNSKTYWKFKSTAEWSGKELDKVNVCDKEVSADLYLKVLGHMASEGCVYSNYENGRYDSLISLNQLTKDNKHIEFKESFSKFADALGKKYNESIKVTGSGYSENTPKEMWSSKIHGRELVNHFLKEIGDGNSAGSYEKKLPRWVMDLCPRQLNILLEALMRGDGSTKESKHENASVSYRYSTVSKQLADDVYEIVLKCGFAPNISISNGKKSDGRIVKEYIVLWSNTNYGKEPNVKTFKDSNDSNGGGASVNKVDYKGKVWCFTVPNGLFVTRRNGKVTIQGNSKYAQADNMVNPLTLVKIGNQEFRPTPVDLDQWRQVFEECHDEETEVLTDQGFMKFDEAIEVSNILEASSGNVSKSISTPKNNLKIACFNPDNEQLEYHEPSESHVYDYDGDMFHFNNEKLDIKVTPNHNMWVQRKKFENIDGKRKSYWDDWEKVRVKDMKLFDRRFRSKLDWEGDDSLTEVKIGDKKVPIELYLEYLGYLISEGCLYTDSKSQHTVGICQTITRKYDQDNSEKYKKMKLCVDNFAKCLNKSYSDNIYSKNNTGKMVFWNFVFCGWDLFKHFVNEISIDNKYKSKNKRIPRWVLNLSPRLLKILLDALVLGDGGKQSKSDRFYHTSSKQLADDVFEAIYKTGRVPTMFERSGKQTGQYTIQWSDTNVGNYPLVNKYSTDPRTKNKKEIVSKVNYKGKVWCFTVPTGLFVTRRNGKITIQGNSQYDKDFKIFTHDAVQVERVGYGQGIYDISDDIKQVIKEIYIGLMVPSVLMDGTDTTYANGSVALDVLRQRYMQFRNMLSSWLRRKIFAPISKIQGFYDFVEGEKVLIVPEIDWNHMSLFDMSDHINNLMQLAQGQANQPGSNNVSLQTLYRSLGLEYEDELRKMRYEDIQEHIRMKENEALQRYSLSELRALTPEDEIEEAVDPPLPGETPFVEPQNAGEDGGLPGGGGGGLPSIGGPPKPPMGAGGGPPKGPGGAPKPPGSPPSGGGARGPTGGGTPPTAPPPPS